MTFFKLLPGSLGSLIGIMDCLRVRLLKGGEVKVGRVGVAVATPNLFGIIVCRRSLLGRK